VTARGSGGAPQETYRSAGVDLEAAEEAVDRIRPLVAATGASPTAFCSACLTGKYPVPVIEELAGEPNSEDGAPDPTLV